MQTAASRVLAVNTMIVNVFSLCSFFKLQALTLSRQTTAAIAIREAHENRVVEG